MDDFCLSFIEPFIHVKLTVICFRHEIQDVSCIKDLTSLYEAATIEDIYLAYEHLKVDDKSLFSCVGVAGAEAGEETNSEILHPPLNNNY